MLSREAINTKFIVFGLTRWGLEPMIYRTRGEHANHYTTDAVPLSFYVSILLCFFFNWKPLLNVSSLYKLLFSKVFSQRYDNSHSLWNTYLISFVDDIIIKMYLYYCIKHQLDGILRIIKINKTHVLFIPVPLSFYVSKYAVMLRQSINWKSIKKTCFYFLVQYTQ